MAEGIRDADLRRLLTVIDACRSAEAAEGLPAIALETLRALVCCDAVSFLELSSAQQHAYLGQSYPTDNPEDDDRLFWRHYWDCAPCCYPDRSGDLLSVTTISDFYTRRQFHNTGMYADVLGPDVEAEAMVCLSAPPGRSRRLIFFRGPGPDFDGRDRLLLSLLRPHLNEAYQELARRRAHRASTDIPAMGTVAPARIRPQQHRDRPRTRGVHAHGPKAPGKHLRAAQRH